VIEGIDGCGSTTHSKRLAKTLKGVGQDVRLTCEPTSGPIGALIRQVLQKRLFVPDASGPRAFAWSTMALLFAADRLDHIDSVVAPALREGAVVVSDRYYLSSLVYQSVTAPDGAGALPWITELNRQAPPPDLTIVIDVPASVAAERRATRTHATEIFEIPELQERLARVYAYAEELVPKDRLLHVSGVGAQDEVALRILHAVRAAELPVIVPDA
jgi:dTMP kinase